MAEWLIGRHAVVEALAGSARRVHEVWTLAGRRSAAIDEVRTRAQVAGVAVRGIEARELGGVAPGATIAARCSAFRYRDEADLPAAAPSVPSLVVVLDGIQDPQNLGAIVRTAEAAGAVALCIPTRRAAQVTPAVVRASAGATEHLPVHRVTNIAQLSSTSRASATGSSDWPPLALHSGIRSTIRGRWRWWWVPRVGDCGAS